MKHYGKVQRGKDIVTVDYLEDKLGNLQDNDTIYDDTLLKGRVEALEQKPDFDSKPITDRLDALEAKPDKDTVYDDTDVKRRLTELEQKPDNDTVYDDAEVKRRLATLEGKTDVFITGVEVSRQDSQVTLKYNKTDGSFVEASFEDKDTVAIAYDDAPLKARVEALEQKQDKDTTYTAGRGIILAGTVFEVNEAQVYGDPGKEATLPEMANGLANLKEKVQALETKPDQDTKYDTEVADFEKRIAELEKFKPKTYTEQLNGASEFTVTHGLGTDFIVKELWQDGFEILADVQRVDNNTLKVTFTEVVTGVEIRVIGI